MGGRGGRCGGALEKAATNSLSPSEGERAGERGPFARLPFIDPSGFAFNRKSHRRKQRKRRPYTFVVFVAFCGTPIRKLPVVLSATEVRRIPGVEPSTNVVPVKQARPLSLNFLRPEEISGGTAAETRGYRTLPDHLQRKSAIMKAQQCHFS
jgi:hypothetical protein